MSWRRLICKAVFSGALSIASEKVSQRRFILAHILINEPHVVVYSYDLLIRRWTYYNAEQHLPTGLLSDEQDLKRCRLQRSASRFPQSLQVGLSLPHRGPSPNNRPSWM